MLLLFRRLRWWLQNPGLTKAAHYARDPHTRRILTERWQEKEPRGPEQVVAVPPLEFPCPNCGKRIVLQGELHTPRGPKFPWLELLGVATLAITASEFWKVAAHALPLVWDAWIAGTAFGLLLVVIGGGWWKVDRAQKKLRQQGDELGARIARWPRVDTVRRIIEVYYSPWGAAKAAKWEELSGDGPFDADTALRLIRAALEEQDGLRGEPYQ